MAYSKEKQAAYVRQHYRDNAALYKQRASESRKRAIQRNRQYVNEIKSRPCADCFNCFAPCAMDFDHINGDKDNSIARLASSSISIKRIDKEIAKCELVCSNCHRIRHEIRRSSPSGGMVDTLASKASA